jgi:hypothetical protein
MMRRLILLLLIAISFSGVYAVCEEGEELFDWTGKFPISIGHWDLQTDEWGYHLYPGANVTGVYLTIDRDYLYLKLEISERESTSENVKFNVELHVNSGNVNYFEISFICNELVELLQKPHTGAAINLTASTNWDTIKNNFGLSAHPNSIEMKVALKFLKNPYDVGFHTGIYFNSERVNEIYLSDGSLNICSTTDMVCGNDICENWEDYATHPCVCPNDCPDMDTTCLYTDCGNGWCEEDEDIPGSICECPEDCPKMGSIGVPCQVGEPITDWSNPTELATNDRDVWQENSNGTDFAAFKSKVDGERLYMKIELDTDETPHENITYTMKLHPGIGGIEYIIFKLNCGGLYEVLEKSSQFPSATNYTSAPNWDAIRDNFTFSTTEHAIEMSIPWYAIYRPSGFHVEVRSLIGNEEADYISVSIQDMSSLFVNTCGDGTCTEEENSSYNWYQYCPQDCPDAPAILWNNGVCDEGEDDRWGQTQFIADCSEAFGWLDPGQSQEVGPKDPQGEELMDQILGPIIVIAILGIVATGVYKGVKKVYSKATAGKRKVGDLKKRKTDITKERKGLQQKFLETRISEEQFHKQMTELEREKQNIDLELKK